MNTSAVFRNRAVSLLLVFSSILSAPSLSQPEMADGEVRRLDSANAKVTIRHGEIKSLDMPPMTMVFVAEPASLLNGLSVSDKIRFVAIEKNNQYIVTKIEKIN